MLRLEIQKHRYIYQFLLIFILLNSLNATDIKPFNEFEFGDTITPIYEKICAIHSIRSIKIGFSNLISKKQFCSSKYIALEQIAKSAKPRKDSDFSLISKVNIENFEYIAKYNLQIIVYGIRIKHEKFELILKLGSLNEEDTVGNYLRYKNDTLKIDNYFIPLSLQTLTLKPTKKLSLSKQEIIYDILMKRYSDIIVKNNSIDYFNINHVLNFIAEDKTMLSFDPVEGITYDGTKYLHKLDNSSYYEYIKRNTI